ncbi:hypothetical protein N658DRAFT_225730 [Parathielavia hyrcaniae]|uniref:Uncharacterized protein n=1 Tax=Parathielavia hyrcaniae TaxID=113614 RepID=A0AAN6PYE1_9PEZI|nr:hypothetical protein N658DRAFT_225730 [Parathielavia hyrcaniae]
MSPTERAVAGIRRILAPFCWVLGFVDSAIFLSVFAIFATTHTGVVAPPLPASQRQPASRGKASDHSPEGPLNDSKRESMAGARSPRCRKISRHISDPEPAGLHTRWIRVTVSSGEATSLRRREDKFPRVSGLSPGKHIKP